MVAAGGAGREVGTGIRVRADKKQERLEGGSSGEAAVGRRGLDAGAGGDGDGALEFAGLGFVGATWVAQSLCVKYKAFYPHCCLHAEGSIMPFSPCSVA